MLLRSPVSGGVYTAEVDGEDRRVVREPDSARATGQRYVIKVTE